MPFAGIEPYAVPAAARGADIIAMEMNEHAWFLDEGQCIGEQD